MIGTGCGLGDSVNRGFAKGFPAYFVGSYVTGGGVSGLSGSSLYFILKLYSVDSLFVFFLMLIIVPVYLLFFRYLLGLKNYMVSEIKEHSTEQSFKSPDSSGEETSDGHNLPSQLGNPNQSSNDSTIQISSQDHPISKAETEDTEAKINRPLNWENFKVVFGKIKEIWLCSFFVYLFNYLCLSAVLAQISYNMKNSYSPNLDNSTNPCAMGHSADSSDCPWNIRLSFEFSILILNVFILPFRASLSLFKVKNFYILPFGMFAVFCLFIVQSLLEKPLPFWLLVVSLGLQGAVEGISVCNLNYLVLNSNKLEYSEKVCNIIKINKLINNYIKILPI